MTGYNYFTSLDQVSSWARYLVENGVRPESDFTMQQMTTATKPHPSGHLYSHAARLAAELPTEYTTWSTLQRLTGKRD